MASHQALRTGRVVAHLGRALIIEDASGETHRCQKRSKLEQIAVGDYVEWIATGQNDGRVEAVINRTSLLSRPTRQQKTRAVAANLDQIIVITALQPACDFLLLDQYLVVCQLQDITPVIVFNKTDLLEASPKSSLQEELDVYQQLGYQLIFTSAKTGDGLAQLKQTLQSQTSLLAGQSGVGKTSLTNQLLPNLDLQTKTLSSTSGLGRHTTTATTLYKLPDGGEIIDSPGVNIFGLAGVDEKQLPHGFREITTYAEHCQFANCVHINEPKCGVKSAVETGDISELRYARYLKLREKLSL